ncbi:hypothetical protein HED55_03410 [Ochrobactrum haematophilum]|uniref:Uncharacterized protein n=1 Tax=Brucella haematophila TaxID=419474 RepID=A0ABX1DJ04_9HYPH|nr:hypothetical protein [Brucella haematophila]
MLGTSIEAAIGNHALKTRPVGLIVEIVIQIILGITLSVDINIRPVLPDDGGCRAVVSRSPDELK